MILYSQKYIKVSSRRHQLSRLLDRRAQRLRHVVVVHDGEMVSSSCKDLEGTVEIRSRLAIDSRGKGRYDLLDLLIIDFLFYCLKYGNLKINKHTVVLLQEHATATAL